jgi:hypothetical protein
MLGKRQRHWDDPLHLLGTLGELHRVPENGFAVWVTAPHLDRPDYGQCRDTSDGHRSGLFLRPHGISHRIVPASTFHRGRGQHAGQAYRPQRQTAVFGVAQPLGDHDVSLSEPVVVGQDLRQVRVGASGEVTKAVRQRHLQGSLEVGNPFVNVAAVPNRPADRVECIRLGVRVTHHSRHVDGASKCPNAMLQVADLDLEAA